MRRIKVSYVKKSIGSTLAYYSMYINRLEIRFHTPSTVAKRQSKKVIFSFQLFKSQREIERNIQYKSHFIIEKGLRAGSHEFITRLRMN